MWEPRRLTTLWASTGCYRDSFTFTLAALGDYDAFYLHSNRLLSNEVLPVAVHLCIHKYMSYVSRPSSYTWPPPDFSHCQDCHVAPKTRIGPFLHKKQEALPREPTCSPSDRNTRICITASRFLTMRLCARRQAPPLRGHTIPSIT
jgi:hypothetical protein